MKVELLLGMRYVRTAFRAKNARSSQKIIQKNVISVAKVL